MNDHAYFFQCTCNNISIYPPTYAGTRPNVTREGGVKVVAIHLTDASAHPNEELLKQHVKKVGKTNVALDFLRDTSRDSCARKEEW